MLVYLDSNIVIYLIEQPVHFGLRASARLHTLAAAGDGIAVGDLTRLECRVNPVARGDQTTLSQYDAFFTEATERVVPLTAAVCDRATAIRAQHRFKTPDALHLAAALEAGCDIFLTNDNRLSAFRDMTVEVLA